MTRETPIADHGRSRRHRERRAVTAPSCRRFICRRTTPSQAWNSRVPTTTRAPAIRRATFWARLWPSSRAASVPWSRQRECRRSRSRSRWPSPASASSLRTTATAARIGCWPRCSVPPAGSRVRRFHRPRGGRARAAARGPRSSGSRRRAIRCCASPTSRAVAALARARGALVVVDNTFLSPVWQRPIDLGADLVVHSTTKYLNGHSDVVGGAVVARDTALLEKLDWWGNCLGVTGSPFDSYLTLRGLRTLHVRMRQHAENAESIVDDARRTPGRLAPVLPRPAASIRGTRSRRVSSAASARWSASNSRAESRPCGASSMALPASRSPSRWAASRVWSRIPTRMTHAGMDPAARLAAGITPGLLRLSIGIEAAEDLIADLAAALDRAQGRLSAVG